MMKKGLDFTYGMCNHFRIWRMWKTDSYRKKLRRRKLQTV